MGGGGEGAREKDARPRDAALDVRPSFPHTGATLPLPPGYAAHVLPPQQPASDTPLPDSPADGEAAAPAPPRAWRAASAFSSLTYWKLDEHPAPSDGARRAVEWVGVAAAAAEHVPGSAVDGVVQEEVVVVD